uniref:Vezatin n=1 Tax=Salarias fasciatus TaxID=181472 RepID=A0A672GCL5_SALFA
FEACPTASASRGPAPPLGREAAAVSASLGNFPCVSRFLCRLDGDGGFGPMQRTAASRKLEQQLDGVFGQYSVRCILDQDVLLQEDVELIELLDPGLLTLGSSPSGSRGTAGRDGRLTPGSALRDVAGLVGLAAALLGLCSAPGGPWPLAAAPWALALLGWLGLRGVALWRLGRLQRDVHARTAQLQSLVHNGKTLTGLSRKALRLVQETEVISRGFTLVCAASSFSRAGPAAVPRGQQLMGLRKALYRALRSAFRASRRATCHMLKIDNVTNYVSAVPLKELGLGLGIEHLGDEQAQELTDDYSLPALKMLFQLWVGQSSECFRRLALLLSPQRMEEQEDPPAPPPPLHRSIAAVTEPLHHALAACLGEVQRSYDFHRHFETQPRAAGGDGAGRAREKCRELNTLHTSIRSLQLHLKALLSEMIILEDDLEKLMVSREPTELTPESYQDLSDRLHHLQPHMQASAGCWEDTVCQVERMLRRAAEGPEQRDPSPPDVPAPPPSFPLILDRDPVPEELEWEAYVSDSDSDGGGGASWADSLSPEERERQRREREESRRVLSELKAVLGFRASEGERMKRKQLLFNDQGEAAAVGGGASARAGPCSRITSVTPAVSCPPPAAVTPSLHPDPADGSAEPGGGRRLSEEGGAMTDLEPDPDPPEDPVTEFSCGVEGGEQAGACGRGGGGASELHQYDGVPEDGGGGEGSQNGLDCFLKARAPAVSLMDRLTEIHGAETLSFSSALAAQVAARSHALAKMEEQTFGDEEEEEEEEEGADGRSNQEA